MTSGITGVVARAEVSALLSRYFRAIDDRRLDRATMETLFTPDARVVRPNGAALVGPEAIAEGQSVSFARFRATQHVSSDHIVDLEGDEASLRANLIAMHLWSNEHRDPHTLETHFLAGGVLHARAVRTEKGWRLSETSLQNVWRTGSGYAAMLATGR
jgi:hypothetical protein